MGKYDDLLDLPCPTSKTHPRMSERDRAAQFAPFAALTGFGGMITETGRVTEERPERSEALEESLNRFWAEFSENKSQAEKNVRIRYFQADALKNGGQMRVKTGKIRKVDALKRRICFTDGTEILSDDVFGAEFLTEDTGELSV